VFVEEEQDGHGKHQEDGGRLAHLEGPRNVRQIVEHDVGQRWVAVHVWNAVMDYDHDERGQHEHKKHVDVADEQLDKVRVEMSRDVSSQDVRFEDRR